MRWAWQQQSSHNTAGSAMPTLPQPNWRPRPWTTRGASRAPELPVGGVDYRTGELVRPRAHPRSKVLPPAPLSARLRQAGRNTYSVHTSGSTTARESGAQHEAKAGYELMPGCGESHFSRCATSPTTPCSVECTFARTVALSASANCHAHASRSSLPICRCLSSPPVAGWTGR